MKNTYKIFLFFALISLIPSVSEGQIKSVYEDMSLDEILNVDVVLNASKKPEDLFEAPLPTTIIKKDEITSTQIVFKLSKDYQETNYNVTLTYKSK